MSFKCLLASLGGKGIGGFAAFPSQASHFGRSLLALLGGKGIRTPDIQLAKLALYQLSYAPGQSVPNGLKEGVAQKLVCGLFVLRWKRFRVSMALQNKLRFVLAIDLNVRV